MIINYEALTITFSLGVVIFAAFLPAWIFFAIKHVQPIQARSKVLNLLLVLGLFFTLINNYLEAGSTNCLRRMFLEGIGSNFFIYGIVLQTLRLLVIFKITEEKLKSTLNESGNEDKALKTRVWKYLADKFVEEKTLGIIIVCLILFFNMFTIAAVATSPTIQVACDSFLYTLEWAVSIFIAIICLATIAIKLIKVHDAYYIKTEFFLWILLALLIVPAYILSYTGVRETTLLFFELFAIAGYIICIIIPTVLALRTYREKKHHRSSSESHATRSDGTKTETVDTDQTPDVNEKKSPFNEDRDLSKYIRDPVFLKFVSDFLLDIQDMRMSDYLNFWAHVEEFKKLTPEFLAAKAYLLYHKFLSKNAYRCIDCMTDELRAPCEREFAKMLDDPTLCNVDYNFFDGVLEAVEPILYRQLFAKFFRSKYYEQFKQKTRLKVVVETV